MMAGWGGGVTTTDAERCCDILINLAGAMLDSCCVVAQQASETPFEGLAETLRENAIALVKAVMDGRATLRGEL